MSFNVHNVSIKSLAADPFPTKTPKEQSFYVTVGDIDTSKGSCLTPEQGSQTRGTWTNCGLGDILLQPPASNQSLVLVRPIGNFFFGNMHLAVLCLTLVRYRSSGS